MTTCRVHVRELENHLAALAGDRSPYTAPDRMEQAGYYIQEALERFGLAPQTVPVLSDGLTSFNIEARLGGQDAAAPALLVGAHYDTVPGCPGADDNASAVAALLTAARVLAESPPRRPVHLVAFALEEYGFLGSEVTARQLDPAACRGMISLEMLGYTDRRPGSQHYPAPVDAAGYPDTGDFIAVVGNEASAGLVASLVSGMKQSVPELGVESLVVPGQGEALPDVRRSDHVPFWERGIPAVMLTDTAQFRNPHYHQPSDTLDTLDLPFLAQVTEALIGYLLQAD